MELLESIARIISKFPCHLDGFAERSGYSQAALQQWRNEAYQQADAILAAPELIALRARNEAMEEMLKSLEWSDAIGQERACPSCQAFEREGTHSSDCLIRATLSPEKQP